MQAVADLGVSTHLLLLLIGERAGLLQHQVVRADLAGVVDARRNG